MATYLEIVQQAAQELGLVAPSTMEGATDSQTIQLGALVNRDCIQLSRDYSWTALQDEHVINVAPLLTKTCQITTGSPYIAIPDGSAGDIEANAFAVSGEGQQQAQRVVEIVSSTIVRCSMESTATSLSTELVFSRDTYELPSGFDRYTTETWWDRTNFWRLIGPDSPQMDQYIRSGIFATGPRRRWRQLGPNGFPQWRIWPPPAQAGPPGALVFEYISKDWVLKANLSRAARMTENSDTPLFDENICVLGVKWRMWQIKGFEYAAMQQEYLDAVSAKFAGDGGIPDLYLNRRAGPFLISSANVQDGNWPGPGNT